MLGDDRGGVNRVAFFIIGYGFIGVAGISIETGALGINAGNAFRPLIGALVAPCRGNSLVALIFRYGDQARGVFNGAGTACLVVLATQRIR